MSSFESKVREALSQPLNQGEMGDADAVGTVGSPECGDMLRMWLKFTEKDGRKVIDRASFQAFGCQTAIAVASMATELLRGKTADEARHLTAQDLAGDLGAQARLPHSARTCIASPAEKSASCRSSNFTPPFIFVLELKDVTYAIRRNGEEMPLVDRVSIRIPKGHFMAIVGPSGCGKTSLLKTIAGLNPESSGDLFWEGRNLSKDRDFTPTEIGYVPQFSIAYDTLTVDESIEAATRLRVGDADAEAIGGRIDKALEETGLVEIGDRRVKVLSGGQMRRLGLAMELVSDPKILLCDEVTS
ncbi:MAG: ATP-binding cassette domain-containing protein, partial [Verrucomicrobia bacterium]|nr:ATP-binding cassette domain-containing protein [Verrucomicrobiota bacterium]